MKQFIHWLNNVSIQRKFIPLQWFIIIGIILISIASFASINMVQNSSEEIIDNHVRDKELLSAIIRNMYVCRVLGRDILLQEDETIRNSLYEDYIIAFNDLDNKMEEYLMLLSGSQVTVFERIIEEKNVYKDSMILSADIWIGDGEYDEALYALQVVTPIANKFFGSIDDFSDEEERLLNVALERNDSLVSRIFITGILVNIIVIAAVVAFIKFFSKNMSFSLVKLERAMSKIAKTGNMKTEIPNELHSKDEVGRIAQVANEMKNMLLEYSFYDALTGGLNTKAYHEDLHEIFQDEEVNKDLWCVITDLNNLKIINDVLGHLEGDNAIRNAYHVLDRNMKDYGKSYRVGGDEFVSILTNCSHEEVEHAIAEIVSQLDTLNANNENKFSLAFGFEHFTGKTIDEYKDFFKVVDKKMYDDKIASKQSRMSARVVHPLDKEEE